MTSQEEVDLLRLELQEQKKAREEAELCAGKERQAREEAELRAGKERQARKEAELRAGKDRQAREEEKQAREEAERRAQKTTLSEYLNACHEYLHKPLGIETDTTLTTKGSTNPRNKLYPETLQPWEDFSQTQEGLFQILHGLFHPPDQPALRPFIEIIYVKGLGERISNQRLANEPSLRTYENLALEAPVTDIIDQLRKIPEAEKELGVKLGQSTVFENTPHRLSDLSENESEVQDRLQSLQKRPPQTPPSPSRSSDQETNFNTQFVPDRTIADRYYFYRDIEDKADLLCIVEYKPPHKLSAGDLQRGFRNMNLKEDVIMRTNIPLSVFITEKNFEKEFGTQALLKSYKSSEEIKDAEKRRDEAIEARLQYNADKLVAAVTAQTFHYMIENGLEYSYITTGETFVFLRILKGDPTTLYYHVTVPVKEIGNDLDTMERHTAVAQVVILCIMAFGSERRDHGWRVNAKQQLQEYPCTNYEALLQATPKRERQLSKITAAGKSPLYKGGRKGKFRSDYNLRSKRKPRDPPDEGGDIAGPSGSSRGAVKRRSAGQQQRNAGNDDKIEPSSNSGRGTQRQYCTQKCLVGLTRGLSLDANCPNAKVHPNCNRKHAINIKQFMDLIQKQLAQHVDHDCEPIGLGGARSVLFKITLVSHGYVFVGKGTVHAFVPDLLHEGHVYKRLKPLQGRSVPVCLGNIDLLQKYFLTVGVRIEHMLLLSWAGTAIKDVSAFQTQIQRTLVEVQGRGVDQNDVRSPNLLWNEEVQRIMLIDYERASIILN